MTEDGKSYPIMTFDQIIDTEIGLIEVINEKYHDTKVFYWSLLEAPIRYKVGLLYNRKHPNPLTVIAKERDNIELMDDYYNQFMEEEYVAILKHSIATNLYKVVKAFDTSSSVFPLIICKNNMELNYLSKIDNSIVSKCTVVVADEKGYKEYLEDPKYSAVYLKDIRDTVPILGQLEAKNIFVAGYRFNFRDDEKKLILNEFQILLQGMTKIKVYDRYNKEDIIEGV